METIIYLGVVVFLVCLNGFFVLAEFSAVKIRPTQMDALIAKGDKRAEAVRHIQKHLDEFLSVCQVGITLASIGLGFVGEPAFAELVGYVIKSITGSSVSDVIIHSIAITAGFIIISFLHIVFGELVPKSLAIRMTEKSALIIAYPMIFFRYLFLIPIWALNTTVSLFFKLIGFKVTSTEEKHSENEVRVILEQSQTNGIMSFRRLLFIENILDMGFLKAKNAMQAKRKVKVLKVGMSKSEVEEVIKLSKYSRYPILDIDGETPRGIIHIKDLYFALQSGKDMYALNDFVRPYTKANEEDPLESLLSTMQRKGSHVALIFDKNMKWTGMLTLEDIIEEVVGAIEEEFPTEQPVYLSEHLTAERVFLNVESESVISAVKQVLKSIKMEDLPAAYDELMQNILEREKLGETYVGHGLCIPHARIKGIKKPMVAFVRLKTPILPAVQKGDEKILYLFILITPIDMPRIHQIFLSRIAGIFESDFLENKLDDDLSAGEIYNLISVAEQATTA